MFFEHLWYGYYITVFFVLDYIFSSPPPNDLSVSFDRESARCSRVHVTPFYLKVNEYPN
jgi:hypothetical protein